jgi:hypothetical protein
LIIVTVWVLAADKVAQESGKEQLATQNHQENLESRKNLKIQKNQNHQENLEKK